MGKRSQTCDEQIPRRVLNILEQNDLADVTNVGVRVHDGIVTISGTVPGWLTCRGVCDAIQRIPEVQVLNNKLTVARVS